MFLGMVGAIMVLAAISMAEPVLIALGCCLFLVAGTNALSNTRWNREEFPNLLI